MRPFLLLRSNVDQSASDNEAKGDKTLHSSCPDKRDPALRMSTSPAPIRSNVDELRKLKQDFLAERISANENDARRSALQHPQTAEPQSIDDQTVLAPLQSLPTQLAAATPTEWRAVLSQLVTGIYAHGKAVLALRPTRLAESLFHAAAETTDWRERVLTNCGDGVPGGHTPIAPVPAWQRRISDDDRIRHKLRKCKATKAGQVDCPAFVLQPAIVLGSPCTPSKHIPNAQETERQHGYQHHWRVVASPSARQLRILNLHISGVAAHHL